MALRLHAYWHDNQLYLWGERLANGGDGGTGEPHADELRAAVGELSPDSLLASVATESTCRLWLPFDEHGVITSIAAESLTPRARDQEGAVLIGELRATSVICLAF